MEMTRLQGIRWRMGFQALIAMALMGPLGAQEDPSTQVRMLLPPGLYAELQTSGGPIVISLAFDLVPMTVANFVGLAEGTIRNQAVPPGTPYYDGTTFHRVAPGHVVQAGIPVSEIASTPGYSIPNEIHPSLRHDKEGMVGMANGGPDTGKSEFYITLADRSYLDGDYVVFGEVVEGMDLVRQIQPGDAIEAVRILRVGAEAGAFRPETASFRSMRREVWTRVRAEEEARQEADKAILEASWPHAIQTEAGWSYVVLREGKGEALSAGDTAMVRYSGRTLRGMSFASAGEEGAPDYFWPGAEGGKTFDFVVGESSVNTGFDEAVAGMARGEIRLVIVPPEMGYDPIGFYGVEHPGFPRFVIRPRSTLIYQIEVMAR